MFVGRVSELSSIRSMTRTFLVYGGRQLGKTALLHRACNIEHRPAFKEYAYVVSLEKCDIKNKGIAEFEKLLIQKLSEMNLIQTQGVDNLDGVCRELRQSFNSHKIEKLILMFDEADELLISDNESGFSIVQQFIDLRQAASNRFKFVFAGLHNVMRAFAGATHNNSPLTKLGAPLCIEPMHQSDAIRLVRYPFSYLGLNIDDQQVSTILTAANNFPGIIHLFCSELITDVAVHYREYYRSEGPPLNVRDDVMSAIISSKKLNDRMREKTHMTLRLDTRYWKLANIIAYLRYTSGDGGLRAYAASDVLALARDYNVTALCGISLVEIESLLDEMCDMRILHASARGSLEVKTYRFRKNAFLSLIGNEDEVLTELEEG
jgi:hypothetical protein